jgi:hypothetical protein
MGRPSNGGGAFLIAHYRALETAARALDRVSFGFVDRAPAAFWPLPQALPRALFGSERFQPAQAFSPVVLDDLAAST